MAADKPARYPNLEPPPALGASEPVDDGWLRVTCLFLLVVAVVWAAFLVWLGGTLWRLVSGG